MTRTTHEIKAQLFRASGYELELDPVWDISSTGKAGPARAMFAVYNEDGEEVELCIISLSRRDTVRLCNALTAMIEAKPVKVPAVQVTT